jgi:RNA polymerase sigma-70 factor (ECF subfamily)
MKAAARSGDPGDVPAAARTASHVAGDEVRDMDALYAAHAPFVANVLQRLTGPGPHVDDLLQETFIVAFRKQAQFSGECSPRTWLYAIASRLSMRHHRSQRRFGLFFRRLAAEPVAEPAGRPDADLERKQNAALVHQVLARLPFKQREVFVLFELEELEGAEVADLLGIPVGTVWTRLHHARKKFVSIARKRLQEAR